MAADITKRRGPSSAHLAVDYFMTGEGDPCFLGRILYRCPPAGTDDCQLDSRCRRKKGRDPLPERSDGLLFQDWFRGDSRSSGKFSTSSFGRAWACRGLPEDALSARRGSCRILPLPKRTKAIEGCWQGADPLLHLRRLPQINCRDTGVTWKILTPPPRRPME